MADDHVTLVNPRIGLGKVYLAQGRLDDAGSLLKSSFEVRKKRLRADDWRLGDAEVALGRYYLALEDRSNASSYLRSGHRKLLDRLGPIDWQVVAAERWIDQAGD